MALSLGSLGLPVGQLQASLNLLPQTELQLLKVDNIFGVRTDARVREFQRLNFLGVDGVVGNLTLAALDLALGLLKRVIPPAPTAITITQRNASALTIAHDVTNTVVLPAVTSTPGPNFSFFEMPITAKIHEFLFEIRKSGTVFFMGAAVPENTTDFSKAHVFFHPTVRQAGQIRAAEEDYPEFKGGWSTLTQSVGSIQRFVPQQGGQLAGAGLKMAMLVPFTTMAALDTKNPSANMFSDRPVETITAVMEAIQNALSGSPQPRPTLGKLGVTSFSSGITALRLFLFAMRSTSLVKEVIDLDSPFIVVEPKTLTFSPGATSKCFSQKFPVVPLRGYVTLATRHFQLISAEGQHTPESVKLHARIGFLMYHQAMLNSVIK